MYTLPLTHFYPRSPCGERQSITNERAYLLAISIHALLAESDSRSQTNVHTCWLFLSTLSLRRATPFSPSVRMTRRYFYPRSPCGERRLDVTIIGRTWEISIHALLAESDHYGWSWYDDFTISIHALLAESDRPTFYDTEQHIYFYPRSPCGERHDTSSLMQCQAKFLSTLSLRRATAQRFTTLNNIFISIHALLAESDLHEALHGGWLLPFLSTLSLRRATGALKHVHQTEEISIHALLAESDPMAHCTKSQ